MGKIHLLDLPGVGIVIVDLHCIGIDLLKDSHGITYDFFIRKSCINKVLRRLHMFLIQQFSYGAFYMAQISHR